jgi:hypothetical protein
MPDTVAMQLRLAMTLGEIDRTDPSVRGGDNYAWRNELILRAMGEAAAAGFKAGIRIDFAEPTWPTVYIELPTGQISWHLPEHPTEYDGHTTEEKYDRIAKYVASVKD